MEVELEDFEIVDAHRVAKTRHAYVRANYTNRDSNENLFAYHLVGALGERAFEKQLVSWKVTFDAAYRDPARDTDGDFIVGGIPIDIKSRSAYSGYGKASYRLSQRDGLMKKARLIVWTNVFYGPEEWDSDEPGEPPTYCRVWLFTWSTAEFVLEGTPDERSLTPTSTYPLTTLLARLVKAIPSSSDPE